MRTLTGASDYSRSANHLCADTAARMAPAALGKGREKRIALRPDFSAMSSGDGPSEYHRMFILHCPMTVNSQLVEKPSRSLDVGEHQRDRSGRQLRHQHGS
jgi:hypothetical protein